MKTYTLSLQHPPTRKHTRLREKIRTYIKNTRLHKKTRDLHEQLHAYMQKYTLT